MADLEEFEEIARPHLDRLYSFACYLTGDDVQAEDLVQETMKKAMNNFDRYEKGTHFKAWASRIMRNLFIDKTRKKKPSTTDFEKYEPAAEEGSRTWDPVELMSEERLLNRFLSDELREALLELPEEYRSVLLLNTIQDLSYEEISKVMDVPTGTVMSRLYRARQKLQEKLAEYAESRGFTNLSGEETESSS